MRKKDTDVLYNELKKAKDPSAFLEANSKEMQEIGVSDYLNELMEKYRIKIPDIIARVNIAASYVYQIFEGNRNAGRDKLIQIAIAIRTTVDEADRLLHAGGYCELYVRSRRDALIMFSMDKGFDVIQTNELLEKNGEKLL